jgi:NAD+-dependent protein deacetylase SIR2
MVYSKCNHCSNLDAERFNGPKPLSCALCQETNNVRTKHADKWSHGIRCLWSRMMLYNEHNLDNEAIGAIVKSNLRARSDALIVVGTSLKILGVRRIVNEKGAVVRNRREGTTIWVNVDELPLRFNWDLVVKGQCDRVGEDCEDDALERFED